MNPQPASPSALRLSRRSVLSGLLAGAAVTALPARPARAAGQELTTSLLQELNDARVANGLAALPEDPHLSTVSGGWSDAMAGAGSMSHNPKSAAQYGLPVQGAGEIVGYARDDRLNAQEHAGLLVDLWMDSPSHRPIILGSAWTDMGIGVAWDAGGRMYGTANFITAPLPALGQDALELSQTMVANGSAARVVIGHSGLAADALAGSALADGNSPVLFARPGEPLPDILAAEIGRVSSAQTRVYLVGGKVSTAAEAQITAAGATPVRLDGSSRYETAALVAAETAATRGQPECIYLARADEWADAVAIGGQAALNGSPVLLVDPDRVPDATTSVLQQFKGAERVVIGGRAAVSDAVRKSVGASRLAGVDRSATGAVVMRDVWGRRQASAGEHLVVTPGWAADGWGAALAHGLYAARHHAPLLFVDDAGVPPAVRQALVDMNYTSATAPTIKFARRVSTTARNEIRAVTGH